MLNETFDLETPDALRKIPAKRLAEIMSEDTGMEYSARDTAGYQANLSEARDYLQLVDFEQVSKWAEDAREKELAHDLAFGDELAAQEIDKMADKILAPLLLTTGAVTRVGVDGMVPNVPAFIQGNPFNMRSRWKDMTGRGPISIFIELTGSVIFSPYKNIQRAASMVALIRAMSVIRPVTIWVTVTFGGRSRLTQCAIRVETSPLDIARLAVVGTKIGDIIGVAAGKSTALKKRNGAWAYGIPSLERQFAGEILGRIVSPGSEIAYIGAGASFDTELLENGGYEAWVNKMLRRFSPHLFTGGDRDDEAADFGRVA